MCIITGASYITTYLHITQNKRVVTLNSSYGNKTGVATSKSIFVTSHNVFCQSANVSLCSEHQSRETTL